MEAPFESLDRHLRRIGAPVDAAECHGALCGALCAPESGADAWLAQVLEGVDAASPAAREARVALDGLAAATRRQFRGGDMAFAPLLPDDDAPLVERAGALGEWCEGFLFGLGTARIDDFDRLPPAVQEVVRDVVEIARVGVPVDGDDSDEAAYVELVEYLRAGVQLVYDELNPTPPSTVVQAPRGVQ